MALQAQDLLLPRPRRLTRTRTELDLAGGLRLEVGAGAEPGRPAEERLARALEAAGGALAPTGRSPLALSVDPDLEDREAYRLEVGARGISLHARERGGFDFGLRTLAQWVDATAGPPVPRGLPGLAVEDRPGFAHRGVMLDVSRDRIPTMATLEELVERFADWKLNQLQLYTEHAFAYRGHESVWHGKDPLTPAEVRHLDRFAAERDIELVPNQQSLGHMHRWLVHPEYRSLAECPEGVEHPFSPEPEPYSLCPTDPASAGLLEDLYGQLLPCFESRRFNVDLDETFDLGLGRSRVACERLGRGRVYADHLECIRGLAAGHGARLQMWADVVHEDETLRAALPEDVTLLEWGYEADHPFEERLQSLEGCGSERYVCPGTSSWNSFGGRFDNMLANVARAARAGAGRATGYLITDWGDHGHPQPACVSWPGFAAGAAAAWNPADPSLEDPAHAIARLQAHVFADLPGGAQLLADAGRLDLGAATRNGSAPFFLLHFAEGDLDHPRLAGVSSEALRASTQTARALGERADALGGRAADELRQVVRFLEFACELGRARAEAGRRVPLAALPPAVRRSLATRWKRAIGNHRELWTVRHRPGGLEDSCRRLERVLRVMRVPRVMGDPGRGG